MNTPITGSSLVVGVAVEIPVSGTAAGQRIDLSESKERFLNCCDVGRTFLRSGDRLSTR